LLAPPVLGAIIEPAAHDLRSVPTDKGYRGWTLGPRSWQLNLLNKFKFSIFRRLRGDASK
jgi:hypothetical protein